MAKILVVDDTASVLKTYEQFLAGRGHTVVTAENGEEAGKLFNAALPTDAPFQAVLTDMSMPGMDGLSLAALIKGVSPDTPVVLATGNSQFEAINFYGVDAVIFKPARRFIHHCKVVESFLSER